MCCRSKPVKNDMQIRKRFRSQADITTDAAACQRKFTATTKKHSIANPGEIYSK
jgi:hypothetical protein